MQNRLSNAAKFSFLPGRKGESGKCRLPRHYLPACLLSCLGEDMGHLETSLFFRQQKPASVLGEHALGIMPEPVWMAFLPGMPFQTRTCHASLNRAWELNAWP